jgi:hypothetical protein
VHNCGSSHGHAWGILINKKKKKSGQESVFIVVQYDAYYVDGYDGWICVPEDVRGQE